MTYSTRDVARLTGATLRQLQYWDERGIVRAGRHGRLRTYSGEQLAIIRRIAVLCGQPGIGLRSAAHIVHLDSKTKRALFVLDEKMHIENGTNPS